jgi:energy-coupling factor transporter transmembrane protein EcfT
MIIYFKQVSALPRTLILLLLFLTAFVWISAILMLIMAARLKWIYWDVAQSFSLRLAITVFTIILVYSVGQMNVVSKFNYARQLAVNQMHPYISSSPSKHSSHASATVRAIPTLLRSKPRALMTLTATGDALYHNTFHYLRLSHSSQYRYF